MQWNGRTTRQTFSPGGRRWRVARRSPRAVRSPNQRGYSVVAKWLHVETKVIDPWVLPIWNAIHRAVQEGRTTRPGEAAGQLALHLSTRLAMLPVIFRRLNEGMGQLKAVIA